ncbi:serine hydrolase FSH [Aspergillus aurantiobrunneus]
MRILCLHGYGTNPEVMKHQMSALLQHCDPSWDFHFLKAQVESPPAPGVGNAFPGPYLCWALDLGTTANKAASDQIHEVFQNEGPFDGVFGFSQGASVMLAYLIEQAARHPGKPLPVRFGVFCSPPPLIATDQAYINSVYRALSPEDLHRLHSGEKDQISQLPEPVRTAAGMVVENLAAMESVHGKPVSYYTNRPLADIPCALHPNLHSARLSIPTLHVCGTNDPPSMQRCSETSAAFCEPMWRRSFQHSSTHNLPRKPAEAREMVSLMEWVVSKSQQAKM